MVITGESGLYRYRVGDVVEITGYYHKTPKMKFIYRYLYHLWVRVGMGGGEMGVDFSVSF